MRNFILLCVLSVLAAGFVSCRKINEATQFNLTYSTSLAVPSASIVVSTTQDFVTDEMATGIAEKFKQNGTSFGAFGSNTMKFAEDAGFKVEIKAPAPQAPSMVAALDQFLAKATK